MRIVAVDGQDAAVFEQFYGVRDAVRRAELEFPIGLGWPRPAY
ncbi:hypothetical protein AB0L70_27820 [Kribbella sp. NPDC051952]